jgi:hypothetical protein
LGGDRCLYLRASQRCNGSEANPRTYVHLERTSLLELLEGTRMKALSFRVLQRRTFKMWTTATSVPLLGSVQQSSSRITENSLRVIGLPYKGTSYIALHYIALHYFTERNSTLHRPLLSTIQCITYNWMDNFFFNLQGSGDVSSQRGNATSLLLMSIFYLSAGFWEREPPRSKCMGQCDSLRRRSRQKSGNCLGLSTF